MTEVERLREALQNCLGFIDTPIGRRKLGLPYDADWLMEARALSKDPFDLSAAEARVFDWCWSDVEPFLLPPRTPTGHKASQLEVQRMPAYAGTHKTTDYPMPSVGDRVVWTSDPDPTCKLTGVKGTVVSVTLASNMPHFHVEPDDWKGARIYATWHSVDPIKEEEHIGA